MGLAHKAPGTCILWPFSFVMHLEPPKFGAPARRTRVIGGVERKMSINIFYRDPICLSIIDYVAFHSRLGIGIIHSR